MVQAVACAPTTGGVTSASTVLDLDLASICGTIGAQTHSSRRIIEGYFVEDAQPTPGRKQFRWVVGCLVGDDGCSGQRYTNGHVHNVDVTYGGCVQWVRLKLKKDREP